ncbi:MAG: hypothetical protein V4574_13350 [Pseudomonadota bacterium]
MSSDPADTPTPIDSFVMLSDILTGINADKLKPTLDTFETADEYFAYALAHDTNGSFKQLMSIYAANSSQPRDTIASIIFTQSGSDVAYMARTVMLMWYLGAWYEPGDLEKYHADPKMFLPFIVISMNSYTQGWVWRVGQTHPMGYSTWRFGYWHTQPPQLSDFIGGH